MEKNKANTVYELTAAQKGKIKQHIISSIADEERTDETIGERVIKLLGLTPQAAPLYADAIERCVVDVFRTLEGKNV